MRRMYVCEQEREKRAGKHERGWGGDAGDDTDDCNRGEEELDRVGVLFATGVLVL